MNGNPGNAGRAGGGKNAGRTAGGLNAARTGARTNARRGMHAALLAALMLMAAFAWTKGFWRTTVMSPFHHGFRVATANPHASSEARGVLKLLYDIKGQYILSGQHNYLEEPAWHTERVRELTGRAPAVVGFELGAIMDYAPEDVHEFRSRVVEEAIRASREGSLVTVTWHAAMPGECDCWEFVHTGSMPREMFAEIVTEGTRLHEEWLRDIDEVAFYLKMLRDAHVPVLWRPYHEMNGNWFWWSGQPAFARLWNLMFDRYVNDHGLDNLLWVWSPAAPNEFAEPFEPYYVGHRRADVLAVDVYYDEYAASHHDRLAALGEGKPIALGEVGELPDAGLLESQNQYVWFLVWGDELEDSNDRERIEILYGSERVLHRDDLAFLRR